MKRILALNVAFTLFVCAWGGMPSVFAQETMQFIQDGKTITVLQSTPSDAPIAFPPGQGYGQPVQSLPPGVVPSAPKPPVVKGKTEEKGKAEEKEKGPAAAAEAAKPPTSIKRTDKPPTSADPKELTVRPGPDGVVHFQFRGQHWPDVLDWYAEIAGVSVDWQELPGDYLNITTQRGYTVEDLGDLLNRLLLARGYTMLPQDEFVNVVKCEELSASLVPRARPEQLEGLGDFDFVRVMFELDWMLAGDAITELDPLLSKNGKIFALKATNRIEAMDAVCNLREIHRLLIEEQQVDGGGEPKLVQEFVLQYAREDVRESITQFLGTGSGRTASVPGMSPQQLAKQQQQMMQMQMQMQQQMAAKQRASSSSRSSPTMPAKEAPVRMMVNPRRNSIIVQAPPDKMATITQAIKLLDVAEQGDSSLQAFLGRMQVYRLASLDPQKLVDSLQALGGLDPTTRLEVDEANRAIIAYASVVDHHTIRMAVEKLDGSARRVEVIPLRHLAADEVAGTIQYLMAGTGEQTSSSRSDYWDPWGGYSPRRSRNEENEDKFRVDADVVQNRLLVRANDMELEEVVSILVKLGEVPRVNGEGDMTRVLDIAPGDETKAFLERLQRDFKVLAPNQLILPEVEAPKEKGESATPTAPTKQDAKDDAKDDAKEDVTPAGADVNTKTAARPRVLFQTALYELIEDPPSRPGAPEAASPVSQRPDLTSEPSAVEPSTAPIVVSIGPDGRIVLSSRDAQALDVLEQLATRTAPPPKDYHVFKLENAPASWVLLNLEDFFEDEDETERRRRDRVSLMWGMPSSSSGDDQRSLSKRKPLKFISDLDTNTILVQGADSQQLKTIADLIELYDVPEPVSSQKARVTKLFTVKYSRATTIAETIKDAFRDLLSSNDRALQNGGKEQAKQPRGGGGMTVISAFGLGGETPPTDSRTSARFEGKLSIGVDDVSNTMLVSTEGENLMTMVADMIEALDDAAKPVSEVRVVKLGSQVDGSRLQQVLEKVLRSQKTPGQQPQTRPQNPQARPPAAAGNSRRNPAPAVEAVFK